MDITPNLAYVYQPMPPQDDGRFYGVAGRPEVKRYYLTGLKTGFPMQFVTGI